MYLLLLSFLTFIYIQFGLLVLTQIVIWLMVFLLSNLLIGINPFSKQFYVIRAMSIIVIIFILYYNTKEISFGAMFILPLSINKITYYEDLTKDIKDCSFVIIDAITETETFHLIKVNETSDFLNKLDDNANYIVNIEFIPDFALFDENAPKMILSKPFLINRYSSSTNITKFIFERLEFMADYYYLDDGIIQLSGRVVLMNYNKFYI